MQRKVKPLTDADCYAATPADKRQTMFDGGGLYLCVEQSGGKLWRMKYRFGGKEKLLSFGKYPDVSLNDARELREEARKLLAEGIDPAEVKRNKRRSIREDQDISVRFLIDNNGALSFDTGVKCLALTKEESDELRAFLSETQTVAAKKVTP